MLILEDLISTITFDALTPLDEEQVNSTQKLIFQLTNAIRHLAKFHAWQLNQEIKPWVGQFPASYDLSDLKFIKDILKQVREVRPGFCLLLLIRLEEFGKYIDALTKLYDNLGFKEYVLEKCSDDLGNFIRFKILSRDTETR